MRAHNAHFSIGTGVVGSGLLTMYVYFEFGYEGGYTLLIGIGYGIISTLFTATYPWLSKSSGATKFCIRRALQSFWASF